MIQRRLVRISDTGNTGKYDVDSVCIEVFLKYKFLPIFWPLAVDTTTYGRTSIENAFYLVRSP